MKLALICDTHWGVRGDNLFFLDQNKKFLDNVFFPTLQQENIDTVIHLGDLVDRRKYVNILTASRVRSDFLDKLKDKQVYILAGNHDCFYKNTNKVNALKELIEDKYNYNVIDNEAKTLDFDSVPITLVPWICDDNQTAIFDHMNSTNAQICMGHFEIEKFPMYKGLPSDHGLHLDTFKKFDMVMSGHYHTRSQARNIWYLGAHAEFTWMDCNDPRGFHIFDTSTRELTFIENPYKVFRKLFYHEDKELPELGEYISSSIIKVVIQKKDDPYKFDKFIEKLELFNPIELQIVEDHLNLHLEEDTNIIDEAESTLDIFKKYIDKLDLSSSTKEPLNRLISELYTEAMSLEETWQ